MKLTIDLSPEQEAALARSNAESNPKNPPSVEEFAASLLDGYINGIVAVQKQSDLSAVKTKLDAAVSKLSTQDLAQVAAVAEKYAGQ